MQHNNIMKNETFYQYLNQNRSYIQGLAKKLSNDFSTACFLYHETAHLAMKNRENLKEETFKEWLMTTTENIYRKVMQNEYPTKGMNA